MIKAGNVLCYTHITEIEIEVEVDGQGYYALAQFDENGLRKTQIISFEGRHVYHFEYLDEINNTGDLTLDQIGEIEQLLRDEI